MQTYADLYRLIEADGDLTSTHRTCTKIRIHINLLVSPFVLSKVELNAQINLSFSHY